MKKLIMCLAAMALSLTATAWDSDYINRSGWMESIPGNARVRELSIPGPLHQASGPDDEQNISEINTFAK